MKRLKKILLSLQFHYPLGLLLMVLYVPLIGVCINFQQVEWNELIILACWIPIGMIPYNLFKKKILYKLLIIFFFIGGFINLSHWLLLKGEITASSLFVLANTNLSETVEFLSLKGSLRLLFLIPYLFLFVYAIKNFPFGINNMLNKYFTFGIFLFISIYFIDNIVHVRFLRKAVPATSEAFIHFTKEMGVTNSLKKRKVKKVSVEITNKKNHVFVLILGESCSRNHMSLYNYARETTPKLEKRKDIFVYNNVVTSHSNTFSSIWMMFTTMNLENDQNKTNCISLMDVFHSAGFQTYWISNQIPIGIWDNDVYNLAQTSNVVVFKNIQANSSFESTLKSSFDEILINPFREALFEKQSNKFIVLHLMGNHSKYSKRYPPNFQIFTNNSSKKTTVVNEYDNSMIYTDFIVDSIFTLLYQQSIIDTNTLYSAIFLSDHGENVYDELNDAGHNFNGSLPKSNVEIPFVVWLSSQYANYNSNKTKFINQNKDLPFVTDDLFHAVIDMNDIKTLYLQENRSIFNAKYNTKRKRILEDNQDYDLK